MGCGAGKTSKESILNSHVPAPSAPKTVQRQGLVAPAGNKLPPEVLDGFGKLLKRFAAIETRGKQQTKPALKDKNEPKKPLSDHLLQTGSKPSAEKVTQGNSSIPSNPETLTPVGKPRSPSVEEVKVQKAPTSSNLPLKAGEHPHDPLPSTRQQVEIPLVDPPHPEADSQVEELIQSVAQPLADNFQEDMSAPMEPKKAFAEDQRYSPEPPRPATPSDDEEAQPYEDEGLRRERLEKEQQAREEAERIAAQQRAEMEEQTLAQRGKMTSMANQANNILAKYQ